MDKKKYSFEDVVEFVNTKITQAEKVNCFTRSIKLQKNEVASLIDAISTIKNFKYQAIKRNEEIVANNFFKMQCLLNSYKSILECWVSIKELAFQAAWSSLIDAQEYCDVAVRIFSCQVTEKLSAHLNAIEKSIFPSFAYYNSLGILESPGICSICESPFNDCDHIENGIYMGTLCRRVDRNIIEINHSAIVEIPHDRRCIFTHIEIDGVMVDNFTRDPDDNSKDALEVDDVDQGMRVKAILFNTKTLDFD